MIKQATTDESSKKTQRNNNDENCAQPIYNIKYL